MNELVSLAERIAERLKERGETVAVAESSTGGLISAALLAVPGASAYFVGGAVLYTMTARENLLGLRKEDMSERPATEADAALMARRVRERHGVVWGVGETGAAGPTGNRYGDPAGHSCFAIVGPVEKTATIRTGSDERPANMQAFAVRALQLFAEVLEEAAK